MCYFPNDEIEMCYCFIAYSHWQEPIRYNTITTARHCTRNGSTVLTCLPCTGMWKCVRRNCHGGRVVTISHDRVMSRTLGPMVPQNIAKRGVSRPYYTTCDPHSSKRWGFG